MRRCRARIHDIEDAFRQFERDGAYIYACASAVASSFPADAFDDFRRKLAEWLLNTH